MRRLIGLVMAVLVVGVWPIQAQQPIPYTGVDILFLVDQSGSMGGPDFDSPNSGPARDPNNLRFEAARYALSTLSTYKDTLSQDITLRMSVVNFGDTTETTLNWTDIQTSNDVTWQQLLPQLDTQLSPEAFGPRNLGSTDFIGAFEAAQEQFLQLDINNPTENHLRAVIVLTDGAPCSPARFTRDPFNCSNPTDQLEHMDELIRMAQTTFVPPSYRVYTIAIDDDNSFWPSFQSDWETVSATGGAQRVENATQASSEFLNIMVGLVNEIRVADLNGGVNDRIGESVDFADGTNRTQVVVPPYYQRMRITVFKVQLESGVILTTPSGLTMNQTTPQVTVTGLSNAIEVWTIDNPEPGNWEVQSLQDTSVTDVVLDLIQVNDSLGIDNTLQTRYVPVELSITLTNSDGDPLQQYTDPRYTLQFDAAYTSPSGVSMPITFDPPINSTYSAQMIPAEVGTYNVNLRAYATDAAGNTFDVINRPNAVTFEVGEIGGTFSEEPAGNILISQTKTVSGQLVDAEGNPLAVDNITVNAVVSRAGAEPQAFPMNSVGEGAYEIVLNEFSEEGGYQISVEGTHNEVQGAPIVSQTFTLFDVSPANMITLTVESPEQDAELYSTGWFPTDTRPVVIAVQTTDQTGAPLDIIPFTDDGALPLSVSLVDNETQTAISDAIALMVTDEAGLYQVALDDLPHGDYTLNITADNAPMLAQATLFNTASLQRSRAFTLQRNPLVLVFYGVSAALIVLVVAGTGFMMITAINRRKHPAKGKLEILRESDEMGVYTRDSVWSDNLTAKKSNNIIIKRGLNRFGVNRIVVTCSKEAMSTRGQVNVQVFYASGKKDSKTLGPRGEMRLRTDSEGGDIYLVKDYEEEGF